MITLQRAIQRRYQLANPDHLQYLRGAIWITWMVGLITFFIYVAAFDLGNFRPVSNDEAWIMSVSYKLATQGIFGSDLYAGFFNADQHYFISLPGHHFLQALSFKIFSPGVAQARWVSLVSGVLLVWTVGWIAFRWYGLAVAILSSALLVFWRSDFIAAWPGLSLLAVARSARYDLGAVTWMWISIVLLDHVLRCPNRILAFALGICAGAATLTQFFGAFILPLIAIALFWQHGKRAFTETTSYWIVAGVMLTVLPYGLYILRYSNDFIGQTSYLKAGRVQFDMLGFYLDNVRREPDRFGHLLRRPAPVLMGPNAFRRPLSTWLLVVSIWPSMIHLGNRFIRTKTIGDRLLGLSVMVFMALLALLEQVKAPLYAIVLLPSVCIVLAMFCVHIFRWVWRKNKKSSIRLVVGSLALGLLAIILLESKRAYTVDLRQAAEVSNYLNIGHQIDSYLTPGAQIVGPERWWWALNDRPYLSLHNLWTQWRIAAQDRSRSPNFSDWLREARAEFIIVNIDIRDGVRAYPYLLQHQFWKFLNECSDLMVEWTDPTYGRLEIYRIVGPAASPPTCWP